MIEEDDSDVDGREAKETETETAAAAANRKLLDDDAARVALVSREVVIALSVFAVFTIPSIGVEGGHAK